MAKAKKTAKNTSSMLQDVRAGRDTEIDYINGYVVSVGRRYGVPTPANAAIVETVHAITRGDLAPGPALLRDISLSYTRMPARAPVDPAI